MSQKTKLSHQPSWEPTVMSLSFSLFSPADSQKPTMTSEYKKVKKEWLFQILLTDEFGRFGSHPVRKALTPESSLLSQPP